jgi:hypothetical protein
MYYKKKLVDTKKRYLVIAIMSPSKEAREYVAK